VCAAGESSTGPTREQGDGCETEYYSSTRQRRHVGCGEMCLLLREGRFREGAAVLVLRRDEHDVDVSCSLTQPPNAKTLSTSSTTRTSTASPPVRRRYRAGRLFDMPWHRSSSGSAGTSSQIILIDAIKQRHAFAVLIKYTSLPIYYKPSANSSLNTHKKRGRKGKRPPNTSDKSWIRKVLELSKDKRLERRDAERVWRHDISCITGLRP
jgi:hypothetical protein